MAEFFTGSWTLTVTARSGGVDRRIVIMGSANADGVYPGDVGFSITVEGRSPWTVSIENNHGTGWRQSLTRRGVTAAFYQTGSIGVTIDSEDSESDDSHFNDLSLGVAYFGPVFEVPFRPYALRSADLLMLPDGIFEASLGLQYMAVRVVNIWGSHYINATAITISVAGRAELASLGIKVIDTWSAQEQEALGQTVDQGRVILGAVPQFGARTVYFKVDFSSAKAQKPDIEFEWIGTIDETPDPDPINPVRHARKRIYVSNTYYDATTGEMITEVPEGRIRIKIRKVVIDTNSFLRSRQREDKCPRLPKVKGTITPHEAAQLLAELLHGSGGGTVPLPPSFDELWARAGLITFLSGVTGSTSPVIIPPPKPGQGVCSGRYRYQDFFAWPQSFDARLEMKAFEGVFSPIPFEDPWWKVALAIAAVVLLGAAIVADLAFHDDDLVIGNLARSQQNDVDAAVAKLNDSRSFGLQFLDAQSGEVGQVPVQTINGVFSVSGEIVTNEQICDLLDKPLNVRKVFKSGFKTGLTHALVCGFVPWSEPRKDDGATFDIPQLYLVEDPARPMRISDHGDSGSVWIYTDENGTRKIIGLHHSGDEVGKTADASPIESVLERMRVTLKP